LISGCVRGRPFFTMMPAAYDYSFWSAACRGYRDSHSTQQDSRNMERCEAACRIELTPKSGARMRETALSLIHDGRFPVSARVRHLRAGAPVSRALFDSGHSHIRQRHLSELEEGRLHSPRPPRSSGRIGTRQTTSVLVPCIRRTPSWPLLLPSGPYCSRLP